jgi:hypothetical protein
MDIVRLCHENDVETRNMIDSAEFEQCLIIPVCILGCSAMLKRCFLSWSRFVLRLSKQEKCGNATCRCGTRLLKRRSLRPHGSLSCPARLWRTVALSDLCIDQREDVLAEQIIFSRVLRPKCFLDHEPEAQPVTPKMPSKDGFGVQATQETFARCFN